MLIEYIHHYQRVVDDNPGQTDDSKDRQDCKGDAHDVMAGHSANQAEGDGGHDHNGLHIGAKHQGQQSKDYEQSDAQGLTKRRLRIRLLTLLAARCDDQITVLCSQHRQNIRLNQGVYLRTGGHCQIQICGQGGNLPAIAAQNLRRCLTFFNLSYSSERNLVAAGGRDPCGEQV